MNLEKLFGSKTKIDILKYLIFRRQGVSMRALETEIWWTFPAIKKQVDGLAEAEIIEVMKDPSGRSITLRSDFLPLLKEIFFLGLKNELEKAFLSYEGKVMQWFRGDRFGKMIGMDVILLYEGLQKEDLDQIKSRMNEAFREYRIETASVVFMSKEERERRYRLADRFVLQVMRYYNGN